MTKPSSSSRIIASRRGSRRMSSARWRRPPGGPSDASLRASPPSSARVKLIQSLDEVTRTSETATDLSAVRNYFANNDPLTAKGRFALEELRQLVRRHGVAAGGRARARQPDGGLGLPAAAGVARGALDAAPEESPDVLRGVQRKLRERSGGKFYADGWSTTRYAPISTFFVTSLMMLSFMVFIYFVIHPLSGSPEMVKSVPTPVQVVPSR